MNHIFTIHANFVRLWTEDNNFAISSDACDKIFISTNTLEKIK